MLPCVEILYVLRTEEIRLQKGKAMRQMRVDADISPTQLCILSGLSRSTIRAIELAKKAWSIDSEILYINAISKYAQQNKL